MTRGKTWFLATCLGIASSSGPVARGQAPPQADAPDEARERKVMERFLGVLEKAPRRGTALDRVCGYHVERGSLDAFLAAYKDKVVANPNDGASWLLIGLVEAQRGRDSAAVEAFRKAEAARPGDALPSYYLGQALALVGQPDAASEAFERALARKPARADLLDIYQALGRVHQRAHRNDKALAVWDRLEKAFPDDPRVQEQIAHALADESQDVPALARFEALARSTRDRFRQVQFAIEAAELKVRLGRSPEALADFESLLGKLDPESWLYREVRRKVEDVFLRTDDLSGLASYYERWIKKIPDDVEAMARLGRTLAGQGRVAEARRWLDEAVKLAPSRRELRLALIEQLVQDRKFAGAAAQYEALAKLEPNNPDVVRDWGRMLLRDTSKPEPDRKEAAAAVWRRLAPDDARDAVIVAQAADLFRQAGLADDAIALYLRAIKLAPDATQYREYLGEYYHSLKRPADALATWRASAEGPARNAKGLGRLGEVLAGFGYRNEAVEPLTEACKLDPDDFDLRLKLADLKLALDRPLEALPELDKAEKVASAEEQSEAVLERLIRAYQASNTLASKIEALQNALATAPTAAGWTRLARLQEADQKPAEAARSIGEATKLDPRSVPAWVATARLREAAGDLLGSAEALRRLTNLDRRSRTDYLTGIAKLEARLGRRGPALEAGRELLAAAPGNPDHHQFFAELCFQLGEPDEGLDALRRAARANPSDPKAMLTLAENLARQFRAEEAIELYWRAFAKTPDVEGRLSIVSRLADQYLQRNQLDRLIGRLERELREPNQQRELSLCLAQAHAAGGDNGTARLELERLLSTNARDTQLLAQLSNLAEQEGDFATAAKYQKQALDVAPSPVGTGRLAQLYLRAGEYLEAESIWARSTEGDQDPARAFSAIDSLLASGKRDAVLLITGRLLRTRPDDWELLYREGVTLAGLNRASDAEARFRAILALRLVDNEKGLLSRSKGGGSNPSSRPAGAPTSSQARPSLLPIQERAAAASRARFAAGVDGSSLQGTVYAPLDFGQARISALAWRLGLAQRENKQDDFLKERRHARDKAPVDIRAAWDWYYLQLVRQDYVEIFGAAKAVAKLLPSDEAAQWAFLTSVANRTIGPNQQKVFRQVGSTAPDATPALPAEDVDLVLACYRGFQKRRPDLAPVNLPEVLAELKRADRATDAGQVYREAMASTVPGSPYEYSLINVATERGDVEGLLSYLDKLERMPSTGTAGASNSAMLAQTYGRTIGLRGVAKAYPDVLAILDRYLLASTRSRAANIAGARPSTTRTAANRNNNAISYWINGQASRGVGVDFPSANERHDVAALGVIRTAYEVFRRDDLLSDLYSHLQLRADAASGAGRVDLLLALGYCRWWGDDKEEAGRVVAQAAELSGPDPAVRMILAELYEREGSLAEALAAVDAVDAIDSSTVQKRENMALRLAVATGNVDRARKAAERLFGLRLDAEAQVQLAALMNQLGMHELAEAVLARARKSAGNKPPALLILMNQYQRQQKTDLALQVALQILRLRPMSAANVGQAPNQGISIGPNGSMMVMPAAPGGNTAAEDDYARREAMQVLSRSGKLDELVARAEAQLDRSPNSMQVLRTLAEYARIANDKDKVKALYDRMARSRPDDAGLRLQLATQLVQAGDPAPALDHYRAALKADPSVLANQPFPILNAFRQADKLGEFASLIEGVDLRSIGNTNSVMNIAQNLMTDPQLKDQGLALFRRIWATFPLERSMFINLMGYNDDWWRLPEAYAYTRDVVIPQPGASTVRPWSGVDVVQQFNGDGRIVTLANRLLDAATRQDKLGELEGEIARAIERHPDWKGGNVLLALVQLRAGRFEEARATVKGLMAGAKEPMPSTARWLIGQDLEDHSQVQDLAEELYEAAVREFRTKSTFDPNDNVNPSSRLLARYKAAGRLDDCRELLLKLARVKRANPIYDPGYIEAQRVFSMGNYAQHLIGLGDAVDAVGLYREQVAAAEAMAKDPQMSMYLNNAEGIKQQAQQGILQALRSSKPEALASTIASLLRPGPEKAPAGEAIDLYLSVTQLGFEKDAVSGGLVEMIRRLGVGGTTPTEVSSGLASVLAQVPDDFAANIAAALLACAEGSPAAIEGAMTRLVGLVGRTQLETLASGRAGGGATARPNARQRADASKQLGLWLVARECWTRAGMKERGDLFAARALEAARRQADPRWATAMLREWGQVDLDLGDREQAERRWSELLDLVLARPEPRKAASKDGRPAALPATPRENFDTAILLARMAAERGLDSLSTRAVREAFRGGSPVGAQLGIDASNVAIGGVNPPQMSTTGRAVTKMARRRVSNTNTEDASTEAMTGPIEARIVELEGLWVAEGLPPRAAYEALRDVVLPVGRPSDVDLYPLGLGLATARHPRSLGDRLATLAVRVGAADELKRAARARRGRPISELSSLVLQVQIELASRHPEAAATLLDEVEARIGKDTLKASAELASHAALPALDVPGARKSAGAVLERAIKNLSTQAVAEPASTLLQALGGHELDQGRLDAGRKRYFEYLDLQDKTLAQNQNNPEVLSFYRRGNLLRVADAFARRGLVADALEVLGRYADIPPTRYGESTSNGVIAALAARLARLPADERYRLLKGWTLPTADGKGVRSLVAFLSARNVPPAVFGASNAVQTGGIIATPLLLIDAAGQAGRLDELAAEVRALEEKSIEEARPLLILVEIARGKGLDVLPKVEALAADQDKAIGASPSSDVGNTRQVNVLPPPAVVASLAAGACLRDEGLGEAGERLANGLIRRPWNASGATASTAMLAQLRRDLLRRKASRSSGHDRPIARDPGLASWTPAESGVANPFLATVEAAWFEHDGHVGLQGQYPNDLAQLAFAFPLAGSFEFSVDAQAMATGGEAAVAFGGRFFAFRNGATGQRMVNNGPQGTPVNAFGPGRAYRGEGFNRVTLRVEPGKVRALVNGIIVAEDADPDPSSPWLALSGKGQASWRFPELVGQPEVPREVRLTHVDRLGGWHATAYGESIAPRGPTPPSSADIPNLDAFDWASRDGEIRGRRLDDSASLVDLQSRLAYARPLLDGESVTYSFLHEPGRIEVHPSLGRLAFLLSKDGVRLHWMTDGPGLDPSGLDADNAVDDPSSRRGPGPIPLKPDAWNVAKLSMSKGVVAIELNGVVVLERPVAPTDDRTFGLFHFKDRTASRVRDVVLRGDWPEKFEAAKAAGLLARSRPTTDEADRRADHALIGEAVLTLDAEGVLRRTRTLPDPARFEALAAWVLPGPDHPTFRLQGGFTPLDPAPIEGKDEAASPPAGRPRIQAGGEPESPANDLVEVARAAGRLDELAGRIESAEAGSIVDVRGRLALLAMVRLAQARDDRAIAAFTALKERAATVKRTDPDWMRWPELTAAWPALSRAKVRPHALAALGVATGHSDGTFGASDLWVRQVRQAHAIAEANERGVPFGDATGLSPWSPIAPPRASSRGQGFPRASWTSTGGAWTNTSGRGEDALLLGVPLRGDFEVTSELSTGPGREANLAYAGIAIRPRDDGKVLSIRHDDQPSTDVILNPPLVLKGDWATWKLASRDRRIIVSIDGRTVFERAIPLEADPWLAIQTPGPLGGSARNVAIAGKPVVPDQVRLSSLPDLAGWSSAESSGDVPGWRKRGDEIVGRSVASASQDGMNNNFINRRLVFDAFDNQAASPPAVGSKLESLLRYRRPMLEDGSIEYEFYFEPGKAMVHPALDRLAFLIQPDGVTLHRVTDIPYERAGLEPGNVTVEPNRRRGSASPTLRPKAWNRLGLTISGSVLTIVLNDAVIYERPVESTNARTFGLFHFADETEARARNIVYRGDWPKAVPATMTAKRD